MPNYQVEPFEVFVRSTALLLDTNVLVAYFSDKADDERFLPAKDLIETHPGPLLVTTAVIAEAWGILVGRDRMRPKGVQMLRWINTPGNATVLPSHQVSTAGVQQILQETEKIDYVDAMLAGIATHVSLVCSLTKNLRVATFDQGDFWTMFGRWGLAFEIYDPFAPDEEDHM